MFLIWVILLFCVPPTFCSFLVSKHFTSLEHFIVKLHLLCAPTPCICGYICLFLSKPNNHCTTCYKRRQRQRNREREPKGWGANNKLRFTENLYKKKISVQTSEHDVSKSLISIFTLIKELHRSINAQIPAPTSQGCSVQEKRQWEGINKSRGLWSSRPGREQGWGQAASSRSANSTFGIQLQGWLRIGF